MNKQNRIKGQFSKTANVVQRLYQMFDCLTNSSQPFTVVLIWQDFTTNLFQHLMVAQQEANFKKNSPILGLKRVLTLIKNTHRARDVTEIWLSSGLNEFHQVKKYFMPFYQSKEKCLSLSKKTSGKGDTFTTEKKRYWADFKLMDTYKNTCTWKLSTWREHWQSWLTFKSVFTEMSIKAWADVTAPPTVLSSFFIKPHHSSRSPLHWIVVARADTAAWNINIYFLETIGQQA